MKYTITPGIAALAHVHCDAFPERYGERKSSFIFMAEGKPIERGIAEPIEWGHLPWPVRKAITKHFDTVFGMSIDERIEYMKTVEPIVVDVPIWSVVEQCGYTGEREVSTWDTYDDAYCAVKEQYTPEEEDELHVSILRDGSSEY